VHELSIAHGIVEVVTEAARAAGAESVTAVHLRIGRLAGVEAGALEFSYELVTEGTMLAGSRLVIEELPVVIYCATCRADQTLPGIQRFRCPACDTPSAEIRQGRELDVASIEIAAPTPVPA